MLITTNSTEKQKMKFVIIENVNLKKLRTFNSTQLQKSEEILFRL